MVASHSRETLVSPMLKLLVPVAVAMVLSVPAPANAQNGSSNVGGNAVNFCQSSLSNLENGVRKRPLAIANEGDATKFVSCSMNIDAFGLPTTQAMLLVTNRSATTRAVSCTLVSGIALPYPESVPVYVSKTASIQPGAYTVMQWLYDVDNAGEPFQLVNFNCAVPPGVELNTISLFNMEVKTP